MPPPIATVLFILLIVGLFKLDRDRESRTSKALWIPVIWLLINGSRPVSQWLVSAGLGSAQPTNSADLYLDGSPIDRNVFTVLLVAGLMVLFSRRRQVGALLPKNAPILVFFSYCALSIVWSDYPFVALKHWIKGVSDLVMVLVVLTDSQRDAALKRFLARAGFLLVPLSVLLIKYYPALGQGYNHWTWTQEYLGVTTTKNMLGMICLIFGLGSAWRLLSADGIWKKDPQRRQLIAHGILLALAMWLFAHAHSTTSLSCFLMGCGLMAAMRLRTVARNPAVIHLLVVALASLAFFALFLDSGTLVESLGKDSTLTGRTEIWKVVLGLTGNPMVGTGYESFWLGKRLLKVWSIYPGIQEAHNGYLEVYLNLGWIGVTLLAILIARGYQSVVAALQQAPDAGRIGLAFFTVGVVYSFTEAGFRMMFPVWICFLLATTCVTKAQHNKERERNLLVPQPEEALHEPIWAWEVLTHSTSSSATSW